MAQIQEEKLVLTLSKLVKSTGVSEPILTQELI
jgi:hypothetical protein